MLASIGVAQVGLVDPIDPLFRFVLRESCDQLARWTGQAGGRQVAGRSGWQSTSAPGSCHRPPSRRSSTGLSSLSRLRDLPIDEVKIDRSFIAGVGQDNARHRLVAGLLAFAERVGLTVVAEGIEREAERDTLTDLGCHRA